MKVVVENAYFNDASRGRKNIRAWEAHIMLDGVSVFSRKYQQYIPNSPGYADRGKRVESKEAAKRQMIEEFGGLIRKIDTGRP